MRRCQVFIMRVRTKRTARCNGHHRMSCGGGPIKGWKPYGCAAALVPRHIHQSRWRDLPDASHVQGASAYPLLVAYQTTIARGILLRGFAFD